MKHIKQGRVIVIGDLHQCLMYPQTILEREEHWDHVVFLGDYLDTGMPITNHVYHSPRNTVEWLSEFRKTHGDNVTFLAGNHDVSYLSTWQRVGVTHRESSYTCSGWTRSKAKQFNHYADPEWVDSLELCIRLGDWVCVHAGFQYPHFKPFMSEWDNIEELHARWEEDRLQIRPSGRYGLGGHFIGMVSPCRGGSDDNSSPVWVDFIEEFAPVEGLKQIVGHTGRPPQPIWRGPDNICIDGMQQYYAVWQDNQVTIKHAYTGEICNPADYSLERDESL